MKKSLILTTLLCLALSACFGNIRYESVQGSGNLSSESRPVKGFHAIELAGSGDMEVVFGESESLVIEGDDNLLPLIETKVQGGTLVISTRPNTNINTRLGIYYKVTMKSLDALNLPGSGNITVDGLQAQSIKLDIPGSGTLTILGATDSVNATINGSGNILCGDLQSSSATVQINGSGLVEVNASESVSANINGSGTVQYHGNPAKVDQRISGSGSVNPLP